MGNVEGREFRYDGDHTGADRGFRVIEHERFQVDSVWRDGGPSGGPRWGRGREDQSQASQHAVCTYKDTKTAYQSQPFYRCHTCFRADNLGCCSACAKTCHSGHRVSYEGNMNAYCDCGLSSCASSCKLGPKCTYDIYGKVQRSQDWYECVTCWGEGSKYGCCTFCAAECHISHKLIPHSSRPIPHFYCDCGVNRHKTGVCTRHSSGRQFVRQPFYRCYTCFTGPHMGCCHQCVSKCHKGHRTVYAGETEAFCDCGLPGCRIDCTITTPY